VEPRSTIVTDGWSGFALTGKNGYLHTVPQKFEVADDKNVLPHVNMIISLLKRRLLGTHQGRASALK
jgi:hypothetical protein